MIMAFIQSTMRFLWNSFIFSFFLLPFRLRFFSFFLSFFVLCVCKAKSSFRLLYNVWNHQQFISLACVYRNIEYLRNGLSWVVMIVCCLSFFHLIILIETERRKLSENCKTTRKQSSNHLTVSFQQKLRVICWLNLAKLIKSYRTLFECFVFRVNFNLF